MLISAIRTAIIYLVLLFMLRIMGKRQIGNMQPHELVITIVIAELGVVSMENTEVPLLTVLVPLMVLFLMQFALSWLTCRYQKMNNLINGRPLLVVRNGRFEEKTLQDALISVNEVLEQMRLSGVKDVKNVAYAILETTGQLSVFQKDMEEPPSAKDLDIKVKHTALPATVILCGKWQMDQIQAAKLSLQELQDSLKKLGHPGPRDIYYAEVDEDGGLFVQPKGEKHAVL